MSTKLCPRCGIVKDAPAFPVSRRSPTGLASWCRACMAANYQAKKADYAPKQDASRRARRAADPDGARAKEAARRDINREQTRKWSSDWRRRHPEAHRANQMNRRARKMSAPGTHTAKDIEVILTEQKHLCAYCALSLSKYHMDHKTPLSRGGSNDPANLCASCPDCNLSKGTMTAEEYLNKRGVSLV